MRKKILAFIKKELKGEPYILSCTPVGLPNPRTAWIPDLDILFIVDSLTLSKYKKIKKILKRAAACFSSRISRIRVEERIGPIKHLRKKGRGKELFIHQMIFDIRAYRHYCRISPLVAGEWGQKKPLFGKRLSFIFPLKKITLRDLYLKRLGMLHYQAMLSNKSLDCFEYREKKGKPVLCKIGLPLTKLQTEYLLDHAITHTINNFFKLLSKDAAEKTKSC